MNARHPLPDTALAATPAPVARRALKSAKPALLALEARLMFDGAAAATEPAHAPEPAATADAPADSGSELAASNTAIEAPAGNPPRAIAFVDTRVTDWQSLVAQLPPEVEVIALDPARDELSQIASALDGRHDIAALHLISHGEAGTLILGGQKITGATLAARQTDLAAIGRALGADGDILLYGCDIGQGSSGQAFIDAIANATAADVAASTDLTGAANLGGDWLLEAKSGQVEASALGAAGYAYGLAPNATLSSDTVPLTETDAVLTTGGTLTITDADPGEDVFVAQTGVAGSGGYGTFTLATDGTWSYTANTAHNEFADAVVYTDAITVASADGTTTTITVNITGSNDAPVAVADTAAATEASGVLNATAGTNPTGNVLTNDTDSDTGDTKTVTAIFGGTVGVSIAGSYGALVLNANGSYTYTVDNGNATVQALKVGETLDDVFTYTVADTLLATHDNTLTVTVNGAADAAVLTPVVEALTETDAVLTSGGTLSITESEAGENVFVAQTSVAGSGGYGTFTLGTDGTWSYTANTAHNEFVDAVVYTDAITVASADGTTTTITVNITGSNDAAVISGTSSGSVTEAGGVANATPGTPTATGTLTNADSDNATDTFIAVTAGASSTDGYGTYEMTAGGIWTYTLDDSHATVQVLANGGTLTDHFTVQTEDGTPQEVTITITGANDAPALTSSAAINVPENTTAAITVASSDPENDTRSYSITGGADAGSFNIDASTGALSFATAPSHATPTDADTNNTYVVTVQADDGNGGVNTQTITVTVTTGNQTPVLTSGTTATVAENAATATVIYTATATDNDAGQTLTYSLGGADAAYFDIVGSTGAVTLKASANFETKPSYSFNVIATDNDASPLSTSQSVTLTITNLDDTAPLMTSGATATAIAENSGAGQVIYTATATDSIDTVTGSTTYSLKPATGDVAAFSIDGSTGAVTLTGNPDYETKTSYSFTVVATDVAGNASEQAVTMSITDANEAPVFASGATASVPEGAATSTVVYTAVATDVDAGQTLTYSLSGADAADFDIVGSTGIVTLKASADFAAKPSYSFNVIATDNGTGSFTASQAVNVTVTPVNDAPVAVADTLAATEDTPVTYTAADLVGNDTDANGDPLTIASVTSVTGGTVVLNGDGTVTFTPTANFNGAASFTYSATDGADPSAAATVTVNVTAVDDLPLAAGDSLTVAQDSSATSGNLAGNDTASGDGGNTWALAGAAGHGTAVVNADGTFTYTPDTAYNGADSFTYTITDGDGDITAAATVNVTVSPAAPTTPGAPVTPEEPAIPEEPIPPEEPITPEVPVTPETPVTPEAPAVPVTPIAPIVPPPPPPPPVFSAGTIESPGSRAAGPTAVPAEISGGSGSPTGMSPSGADPVASERPVSPNPAAGRIGGSPVSGDIFTSPAAAFDPMTSALAPAFAARAVETGTPSSAAGNEAPLSIMTVPGDRPALVNYRGIPDVSAGEPGQRIAFQIPATAFAQSGGTAAVTLSARLADGRPLPASLRFNPVSGRFEGTLPEKMKGDMAIKVVARDAQGREANAVFRIRAGTEGESRPGNERGRAGLSQQLRSGRAPAPAR